MFAWMWKLSVINKDTSVFEKKSTMHVWFLPLLGFNPWSLQTQSQRAGEEIQRFQFQFTLLLRYLYNECLVKFIY